MIEDDFIFQIEHSRCIHGKIEKSTCDAFKIDNEDGLGEYLGFNNSALNKVDYFCKKNHSIQLIELSDLENDIKNCTLKISEECKKLEQQNSRKITGKEKKKISKSAWLPITCELKRKWGGSIAIVERLYRKNRIFDDDPSYQFLIVCKDDTDIYLLDILQVYMQGMVGNFRICKTNNLEDYLIDVIPPP